MEQRGQTAGRARLWDGAHGLFWREAARRPRDLGAVVPSSRALARAMAMAVPPDAERVAELGAGTGALTRGLWERGLHPAHCLLVEPNPVFAAHLRRSWPTARVIQGYAQDLLPTGELDAVVSGLPLRAMDAGTVEGIVAASFAALRPEGVFVQFTYGLRCPIPGEVLERLGLVAERWRWVYANIPPACVWRVTRAPSLSV